MPGAQDEHGRIQWQVSSGVDTSFNRYYKARWEWWVQQADRLGLEGTGDQNERFTIAARLIHPSGKRPCLVCGQERDIGYFYANARLAKKLNKVVEAGVDGPFFKGQSIEQLIDAMVDIGSDDLVKAFAACFTDRLVDAGEALAVEPFVAARAKRSAWLSPGYMGDPPYRLDGLHDYCTFCRENSDPGRSRDNLRTYTHDRRAFEWWAEGDWAMADALFRSSGPGICDICGIDVPQVSPDHPGPLACGFKHMALFVPTCPRCNSSKNRRMRLDDVWLLIGYEDSAEVSVASAHVRAIWDSLKLDVKSDQDAERLSTLMRAAQDVYLRGLALLLEAGAVHEVVSGMRTGLAYNDYTFTDLDPSKLSFTSVEVSTRASTDVGRSKLARRSVRIAVESLREYQLKGIEGRRLHKVTSVAWSELEPRLRAALASYERSELDGAWASALAPGRQRDEMDADLATLMPGGVITALEPAGAIARNVLLDILQTEFVAMIE